MKLPRSAVVATFPVLFLLACDPAVDQFEENHLKYSVFGYLHVSADTQFIRIERLRDGSLTRAPDSLPADVILTNLTTDRTVLLQDSLFRFPGDATAHNFYTTTNIEPSTPYRLIVQGPEGAESRAQTTVPDRFPTPSVVIPIASCFPNCPGVGPPGCSPAGNESRFAVLRIIGIDRVVAVRALYYMDEPGGGVVLWPSGRHDTCRQG